jgi:YVTN family beta-propeller protein
VRARSAALRRFAIPLVGAAVVASAVLGAGGGWAAASGSHPKVLTISGGVRPIVEPINPCRLVDTRAGSVVGPRSAPIGAGETYTLTATGAQGSCAVPVGAVGLVLNVTVLHGTRASYLTVFPGDQPRPSASNLNWAVAQAPTPNQVTVGLSASGQISVYNNAGTVDLLVDVVGYLADHNFDDRYYTKAQIDSAIGSLAPPPDVNRQRIATLHWYSANTVTQVPVANGVSLLAFDGTNMWVTGQGSTTIEEIRASDNAVIGTFPCQEDPMAIAFDGANIWTAAGTVDKLRASDGAHLDSFLPGTGGVTGLAFDGTYMWGTNTNNDTVSKIDTSSDTVVATYPTGHRPMAIAFDGTDMWVANTGSNTLSKIRASDGTLDATFAVGEYPNSLAFDGTAMWVSAGNADVVEKLDLVNGTEVAGHSVAAPQGIAFDGSSIWVAGTNVTKLRVTDASVIGSWNIGFGPRYVAFDGNNVWVGLASGVAKM